MKDKVSIKKEYVLNAYNHASEEQKALLENMFGKDVFQKKNIMERVKTFGDACEVLGEDHQYVKAYREWMRIYYADCKDITAYLKLRIICAALNEGWEPKFDGQRHIYYPWFYIYTKKEYEKRDECKKEELRPIGMSHGSAFVYTGVVCASATITTIESGTSRSSRIALKTRELAEYCGKQFIDIWVDYLFA